MINRRQFVSMVALTSFGRPFAAEAQQAGKVYRIGLLFETTRSSTGEDRWRSAFHRRGYVAGQNAVFEFRWAGERFEHLQALAEELVRLKVDIIVTGSTPPAVAAKRATTTIPIITQSADPIRSGLVAGLARPGGNVTGIFVPLANMGAKRLQLLRETVPNRQRGNRVEPIERDRSRSAEASRGSGQSHGGHYACDRDATSD